MPHNKQKKIAVINDFCGFGRCSLAVSLPIISALKVQCCPLPTALFTNHTAFDSFYSTDLTPHMDAFIDEWSKLDLRFSGILTGFLESTGQINIVSRFLERFKSEETVTVVDPVMGDGGSLYRSYSPELANMMIRLVPHADVLTPNLTEACILTATPYTPAPDSRTLFELCSQLSDMGPQKVVISGLERGDFLENYVYVRGHSPEIVSVFKTGSCRAGTGDVFSSIIAADTVNGLELTEAVSHAADFIAKALKRTDEIGLPKTDGICFEELLKEI
ncbi:MAG: pyridoxamine kinase [Clostridia bacterium]|nr:pyridoxamine kinase [Clostridia bacterium]